MNASFMRYDLYIPPANQVFFESRGRMIQRDRSLIANLSSDLIASRSPTKNATDEL